MVSDSTLAKDVEPRFQIYHQGRHLEDKDDLLQQPRLAGGREVTPLTLAFFLNFNLDFILFLSFGFSPGACHEGDPGVYHPTTALHRDDHAKCEITFVL